MARYKIVLAYDGTAFNGFQRQPGARTVQGEVEIALAGLGWHGEKILAAGRTDTGVHAAGQVIAFDLDWMHPADELLRALNATLPEDVAARQVDRCPLDFHPRYDAQSRRYGYRLLQQPIRDPLRERYAWRVWPPLDLAHLNFLAGKLVGEHDFSGFGSPLKPGSSPVRKALRADWKLDGQDLFFEIEANAFLFRMVRRIVMAQVEVAAGRLSENDVDGYLSRRKPGMVQGLAPARGLTLLSVGYPASENKL